ncbi:hypothetical protein M5K25_013459 [Dendrobium thyrsiflorum]|uniref:Reverse transcriptase zinc-binding domain-containing protein n=1 Tax=Dendrobium thyrsiflorum TaxID=117978 RepID=A0ABD0UT82_DENTH
MKALQPVAPLTYSSKVLRGMLKDWMLKYKGDNSNVIKILQQVYARNYTSSADFQFFSDFNNVIFNCIGRGGLWNCRRARKKKASLYLKEVVKNNDVFFLLFWKLKFQMLKEGILICWWDQNGIFSKFRLKVFQMALESSSQFVIGDLDVFKNGKWRIAFKNTLGQIGMLFFQRSTNGGWGDFNCLLSKEDKKGGKRFSFSLGPKEMNNFISMNDLHEVGFFGSRFTWCNNKIGAERILERLDMCFVNSVALNSAHRLVVRHFARIASDHNPIVFNLLSFPSPCERVFKFQNVWAFNPASAAVVKRVWMKKCVGSYSQILSSKMRNSVKDLFYWSKAKNKNIFLLKDNLLKDIEQLQGKEADGSGLSDDEFWALKVKVGELNSTLAQLDTWWRQRTKSCLLFGNSVNRWSRKAISKIMKYKSVKELDYLGVKQSLRRLHKADYQFIIDKAIKFTNIWGSKVISLAGKILLIKSILLSLTTFHCTISLVPKGILDGIDKICRSFIWNKYDGRFGIHFVNWISMCCLLNWEIAWKYANDKDSLLHKVFFPKYGCCLKESLLKNSGSSAWKIISEGGKALRLIIRWGIANGKSVDAFNDTWILDKSLNRWPTFVIPLDSNISIDKLIDNSGWNRVEISNFMGIDLVDPVCQTHIHSEWGEDQLKLLSQNSRKSITALSFEASLEHKEWNWIKKAKLNPRVEVFWWRLFNNAIPTFHFLSNRRLYHEDGCPRRCNEREDLEHVAVKCKKLLEVLVHLGKWGFFIPLKKIFFSSIYIAMWFFSWKSRNKLIHNGIEDSSLVIAINAISFSSFSAYGISRNSGIWGANQSYRLLNLSWYPPPPDWIKVNVDASLLPSYKAGIGGIFRDHKGRFLLAFAKSCVHWDVGSLELSTTLYIK